ncbi:MAG: hypothetical protein UMU75_08565 [Halomonas sp.]|nr:hypothetical protein [Halomonas sp.]
MNTQALPKDQHLITQQNLCRSLDMTRSGIAKLRLNDPTFPKPIKFSDSKQATCYFAVSEVNAWIEAKLAERGAA